MTRGDSRLVYTTDGGRVPVGKQRAAPAPARAGKRMSPPDDGVVRVMRTKQGRAGKTVTLVTGLPGSPAELEAVLRDLKRQCGTGGALEGRDLAIQGDQRERIVAALEKAGHRVKLAGG